MDVAAGNFRGRRRILLWRPRAETSRSCANPTRPREGAGYDYDVVTAEVILNRMKVARRTFWCLPGGVSYRLLALPDRTVISLPVFAKVERICEMRAAIVIGTRPVQRERSDELSRKRYRGEANSLMNFGGAGV